MKKYQKKWGYGEQRIKIAYIFVPKNSTNNEDNTI